MIKPVVNSIVHLLFPRLCNGCGSDLVTGNHLLCLQCFEHIHTTGFAEMPGNPVEKKLWGRVAIEAAMSGYYFSKDTLIQKLIHQTKYRGNKTLGVYLGKLLGQMLSAADRLKVDVMVPLPLFIDREKRRGYNQSALLCEGIAESIEVPVITSAVKRIRHTETQTHKSRMERWKNVEGVFYAADTSLLAGKHVLLVDDVITTGATIEACGNAILEDVKDVQISIATLACAI